MSLNCVVYGFHSHTQVENKTRSFRFPNKDPELQQKWINTYKRERKSGSIWNPSGKTSIFVEITL